MTPPVVVLERKHCEEAFSSFSVFPPNQQQAQASTMKLFPQVLAAVALLAIGTTEGTSDAWEIYRLGKEFGEPHGTFFSDTSFAKSGEAVHTVTIRTGERVNGVGIDVTPPGGQRTSSYHGGNGGKPNTLTLNSGERFNCVEAHWGKHEGRTRIRYIKITTTAGRSIAGGTPTPDKAGTDCAPHGYQLGGWRGSSGAELDQVSAVWTGN